MKKVTALIIVFCMFLGLTINAYAKDKEIVSVTLSPMPFVDDPEEQMIEFLGDLGIESYEINDDYSASFSMDKDEIEEIQKHYIELTEEGFKQLEEDENYCIREIDYNDDFTSFDVRIDTTGEMAIFEAELYSVIFAVYSVYYQELGGIEEDDAIFEITVYDVESDEVLITHTFEDIFPEEDSANLDADADSD